MEMSGWKTKTAAVSGILIGLGTIIAAITFDPFSVDGTELQTGLMMIAGSLGIAGLGHKIEKSTKEK